MFFNQGKDPFQEYLDGLKQMAVDLNKNLESVKAWMSSQHLHNELFLEQIAELKIRVRELEEKLILSEESKKNG